MSIRTRFNPLGTIGRKALLPAGYIELEYLESTGEQYIDTGLLCDYSYTIDLDIVTLKAKGIGFQSFFGYATPNTQNYKLSAYVGQNNNFAAYIGNDAAVTTPNDVAAPGSKHSIRITEKCFFVDNILYSDSAPVLQIGNGNMYLFARNGNFNSGQFRIYTFKVKLNNKLVLNFIPALDPTGRPCMFDTLSQQPFYNKGTGEFKWRAKLPKEYTALEYLESTGTQRIFMPRISDLVNVTTEHTYTRINPARSCVEFWQNTIFLGIKNTGEFYFANKSDTLFSDGTTATVGTRYKMTLNENGLTVNGHFIPGTRGVRERPEYVTVGLFSAQNSDYQCWLKKYYWIETLSEKMVRCVVPALDASNRPCMFDLVKRKTYYNAGTGEFLYG